MDDWIISFHEKTGLQEMQTGIQLVFSLQLSIDLNFSELQLD
jgi:hypothetical protein